ncbi:MAG: acetolactate synthase small subunit [Eubacterium sp.]|nr:acetolactate synthase small subunit [Eubacterium sp.]
MAEDNKIVLSLLVDNVTGVLSRISNLFSRRAYNIDSITAGVTADPRFTRLTIVSHGDDQVLEQIQKQLSKLVDVRDVKILKRDLSVIRELMLVKVKADENDRQKLLAIAGIFRGNVIDVGKNSLIFEVTGNQSKLNGFLELLSDYEILELARTGITGLSRGMDDVRYF